MLLRREGRRLSHALDDCFWTLLKLHLELCQKEGDEHEMSEAGTNNADVMLLRTVRCTVQKSRHSGRFEY